MRQAPPSIHWSALRDLRDLFLAEVPLSEPYWTSRSQLEAYDCTLGERIGWKWDAVLSELRARNWTPPSRELTDLGCGSGIAARRLLAAFPEAFDRVSLIDHSTLAAGFARERIADEFPGIPVRILPPSADPEGVVLISHVLTELPESQEAAWLRRLSAAAALLWVEPGTQACGKRLVHLRESLRESFRLVAPCPHQGACGLLQPENEAHWCHHFAPAPASAHQDPFWGHFRRELNLELGPVAYSFLVCDHGEAAEPGLSHLIGQPLRFPKFLRVLSCQAEDISELVASRRAGDVYRPLKRAASPALYRFERRKNRITGGSWLGEEA